MKLTRKNTAKGVVWRFRYLNDDGDEKIKAIPVDVPEEHAEQWAIDWLKQHHLVSPGPKATLSGLAEDWLLVIKHKHPDDPRQVSQRRHMVDRFIHGQPLGDHDLNKLTIPQCADWVRWVKQQKSMKTGKPLAPMTVRNIVADVRGFIRTARGRGWVTKLRENPMADEYVTEQVGTAERLAGSEPVVMNDAQAQALLAAGGIAYSLGLLAGMRLGEICGLDWDHVFLDANPRIHVAQQLVRVEVDGAPVFKKPKRGSKRWVPIHPRLAELLRAAKGEAQGTGPVIGVWRKRSPKLRIDLADAGHKTVDSRGNPLDFHSTRRTFLTALSDVGAPMEVIRTLAGHAAGNVTEKSYISKDHRRYAQHVDLIFQLEPVRLVSAAE